MDFVTILRLATSAGLLGLFSLLEHLFPRRERRISRVKRWPVNIGMQIVNGIAAFLVRFLQFFSPIFLAQLSMEMRFGLFHQLALPLWFTIPQGIVVLDLAVYFQHRIFHEVGFLWKIHRLHHQEKDLDASSAFRFHTLEILASLLLKGAVVFLLGIPFWGVVAFDIILNGTAIFNHANLKIPPQIDKILRLFIVTPDMHRVHHSEELEESMSNYGFNLPIWDRIFGTYRRDFAKPNQPLGLPEEKEDETTDFVRMMLTPFRRDEE